MQASSDMMKLVEPANNSMGCTHFLSQDRLLCGTELVGAYVASTTAARRLCPVCVQSASFIDSQLHTLRVAVRSFPTLRPLQAAPLARVRSRNGKVHLHGLRLACGAALNHEMRVADGTPLSCVPCMRIDAQLHVELSALQRHLQEAVNNANR